MESWFNRKYKRIVGPKKLPQILFPWLAYLLAGRLSRRLSVTTFYDFREVDKGFTQERLLVARFLILYLILFYLK